MRALQGYSGGSDGSQVVSLNTSASYVPKVDVTETRPQTQTNATTTTSEYTPSNIGYTVLFIGILYAIFKAVF